MPEEHNIFLRCDYGKECPNPGEWYAVEMGGNRYELILCAEHSFPVRELAQMGVRRAPANSTRKSNPRRNSDEARVLSLIVED